METMRMIKNILHIAVWSALSPKQQARYSPVWLLYSVAKKRVRRLSKMEYTTGYLFTN